MWRGRRSNSRFRRCRPANRRCRRGEAVDFLQALGNARSNVAWELWQHFWVDRFDRSAMISCRFRAEITRRCICVFLLLLLILWLFGKGISSVNVMDDLRCFFWTAYRSFCYQGHLSVARLFDFGSSFVEKLASGRIAEIK